MFDDLRRALTRNEPDDARGTFAIKYRTRGDGSIKRQTWLTKRQAEGRVRALHKRGYRDATVYDMRG